MTNTGSKHKLRQSYLELRSSIDPATYRRKSRRICEILLQTPELKTARTVLSYWPLVDRREVDLRPLNRELLDLSCRLLLPVVTPGAGEGALEVMVTRLMEKESDLVQRKWNLMEPLSGPIVPPDEIDLVLVPAVAVDRRGARLGYGKAFYDRFLTQTQAFTVGIVFDSCAPHYLPVEAHDFKLHARITECGIHRIRPVQPDPG